MPGRRFQKLAPERRDRILGAAAAEFAEAGFAGAAYNRIIERAGVSKGAMYYYFEDKADLCRTSIAHALAVAKAEVGGVDSFQDAASFWDALHDLYRRAAAFIANEPAAARLLQAVLLARDQPVIDEAVAEALRDLEHAFAELLDGGVKVDAVRADLPTDLLAAMITAMAMASDVWMLRHWDRLSTEEISRYPDWAFALHRRVLEAGPQEGDS